MKDTKFPVEQEGVIQFAAEHQWCELSAARHETLVRELGGWRQIFVQTGLLGSDALRYQGLGFGNLSGRVTPPSLSQGHRRFLITGSQTGEHDELTLENFALVLRYCNAENRVQSRGGCLPSSESMTHGSFYDLTPMIRYVFHVHAPAIWQEAARLRLPTSHSDIAYGTPEMAREVERLFRSSILSETRVMVMGGHADGVIGFGRTAQEAGLAIMTMLAQAYGYKS